MQRPASSAPRAAPISHRGSARQHHSAADQYARKVVSRLRRYRRPAQKVTGYRWLPINGTTPHARTHARMHAWGAYSESLVTIGNHGNRRGQSCASRRTFVDLPLSFRLNDGSPNVTVISLPNARSPRIRTSGSAPSTFSYRS